MRTNQDYKNAALAALKGNWPQAVGTSIILLLLAFLCSGSSSLGEILHFAPGLILTFQGIGFVLILFVMVPMSIGLENSLRVLYETGNGNIISNTFSIATGNYLHLIWVYFVMEVKIFLWTCLLIVPGIIKSFAYAMTPFIAVEHPEYTASQCTAESSRLMKGHKFDLFYLYLTFIGWALLSILTCGIGFFWLVPYMETTQAAFYNDLKAEAGYNVPLE